jgi:hypothetical protein
MSNIINQQPVAVPILGIEVGYYSTLTSYSTVQDNDLYGFNLWIKKSTETKAEAEFFSKQIIGASDRLRVPDLDSGTQYNINVSFSDLFVSSDSALLQSQYLTEANVLTLTEYNITTLTPVSVVSYTNVISEGTIGNPASTVVLECTGSADILEVQIQEVGESTWVTVYKSPSATSISFSINPGSYNLRYASIKTFSDGVVESTGWTTFPSTIEAGGSTMAPNAPTSLVREAYRVDSFVSSYKLVISWDFISSGGGIARNFFVDLLPNPTGVTDLATLPWAEARTDVTTETSLAYDDFPYRRLYAIRVATSGWGTEPSSFIYGSVYITNNTEESVLLGYLAPEVLPYKTNTKVQVSDDYIRGYKVFDVETPSNSVLTFEFAAATGNVKLGTPGVYSDGTNVTVPFLFDATTNRLQISGHTITDKITAASYVMGWLGGETPTFRTANKASYGDNLSGIWMGYSDTDTFQVDIGSSAKYIRWDGTDLKISGNVTIDGGPALNQMQREVFVYRRSATAPTTPTGGSVDFDTGVITAPASWSVNIPTGTDPVYMTSRLFTSDGQPPQVATWSTPGLLAQNGQDGSGDPAKLIAITSSRQYFTFTQLGVLAPASQSAVLSLIRSNITGATTWSALGDGVTPVALSGVSDTQATLTSTAFSTYNYVVVSATAEGITDTVNIVRLTDGASPIVGYLTNETHSVAASSTGTGYVLTGSGGTFKLFEGLVDRTTSATFSVVAPATVNGLTMSINSSGVYSLSGSSWTSSAVSFTLRAVYNGITTNKVYSISKSLAGTTGGAGAAGARGAGFWRVNTGTSDSVTGLSSSAVNTLFNTLGVGAAVSGDQVVLVNTLGASVGYAFTTVWAQAAAFINGSLVVAGSIGADRLVVDSLTGKTGTIGLIQTRASGVGTTARTEISIANPLLIENRDGQPIFQILSKETGDAEVFLKGKLAQDTITDAALFSRSGIDRLRERLAEPPEGSVTEIYGGYFSANVTQYNLVNSTAAQPISDTAFVTSATSPMKFNGGQPVVVSVRFIESASMTHGFSGGPNWTNPSWTIRAQSRNRAPGGSWGVWADFGASSSGTGSVTTLLITDEALPVDQRLYETFINLNILHNVSFTPSLADGTELQFRFIAQKTAGSFVAAILRDAFAQAPVKVTGGIGDLTLITTGASNILSTVNGSSVSFSGATASAAGLVTTETQVWSGQKTINNFLRITHNTVAGHNYSNGSLELMTQNGSSPSIGFHRGGFTACQLRHDANGLILSGVTQSDPANFEAIGGIYGSLLGIRATAAYFTGGPGGSINAVTANGFVEIGPQNPSYCHFQTDRPMFYMNKPLEVAGRVYASQGFQGDLIGSSLKVAPDNIAVFGASGLQFAQFSGMGGTGGNGQTFANPDSDWWHHIVLNHANGGGYYTDIATCFHKDEIKFRRIVNGNATAWQNLIHSGNFTAYSPSLVGGGASGTWGINISGVAQKAGSVGASDFRGNNYGPSVFGSRQVEYFFDNSSASWGIPGSAYVGVMTYQVWDNGWSGGPAHQLAFADTGDLWHRTGASAGWATARKIARYETSGYLHVDNWIRVAVDTGVFCTNGVHWYSPTANTMRLYAEQAASAVIAMATAGNTLRGHIYADSANQIGFLNQVGNWSLRVTSDSLAIANDFISTSDRRTKDDLILIPDALNKLGQLTGYTFLRKGRDRREAGYIAQDLQAVLSEGVYEHEGVLQVSNSAVIGLLIEAVKELTAKVNRLEGYR